MDVTERNRKSNMGIDSLQIKKKKAPKGNSTVNHVPVTRSRMKGSSNENAGNDRSDSENMHRSVHKRQKIYNYNDEIENIPNLLKLDADHCEKENMVDSSWIKSNVSKSILAPSLNHKDAKPTPSNCISGSDDHSENKEAKVQKSNKTPGPLSPIDSQSLYNQSSRLLSIDEKPANTRVIDCDDSSSQYNESNSKKSHVESSLNDICSSINDDNNQSGLKEEVKFDFHHEDPDLDENFLQPASFIKKKSRKRVDPVLEKKRQNYECYKEFCKLRTIYTLISKELKIIQVDSDRYEDKLNIIKENKERHEDELGYYLGIEDNRKKRVRRLATEIERKHRCLVPKCPKAYGSEGSLNQHLIRKHPLVFEEWMKRITEKEKENELKKNQVSREEKDQIRRDIEKIITTLCQDDESNYDDSDSE